MADLSKLAETLIAENGPEVKELIQKAIEKNVSSADILENGLIA